MIFLLLSILSGVTIVVCFKLFERLRINTFQAIIINYLTAFVLGFLLTRKEMITVLTMKTGELLSALIIGILFVVMFRVLGKSVQKAGMGISAISAKISVAIPITFSLLFFHENIRMIKIVGIILSLASLILTIYRKEKNNNRSFVLPLILFFGMGFVDSMVRFAQGTYLHEKSILAFSTVIFLISFLAALFMKFTEKNRVPARLTGKLLLLGILLGIANLGSLYFFINALNSGMLAGSLIFAINNIGILVITVMTGVLFFRERLNAVNWVGFTLSLISLYIIFEG